MLVHAGDGMTERIVGCPWRKKSFEQSSLCHLVINAAGIAGWKFDTPEQIYDEAVTASR